MSCKYLTTRSKNYKKYFYCRHPSIKSEIDYSKCNFCTLKEYKTQKPIPNKKKARTIATSIPKSVKEKVWKRDNHQCIFCHKNVPIECACCHEIRRSQRWTSGLKKIFLLLVITVIKHTMKAKTN